MSYVVYNKETTIIPQVPSKYANMFKDVGGATEGAAKAALTRYVTRMMAKGTPVNKDDFAIAEAGDFYQNIEKKKKVRNLLNPGAGEIEIGVNTSACCDPSTETYHCM